MDLPLCYFCLKSGLLCQRCSEKVRKGEVTNLDLEIAKKLLDLETCFAHLKDCTFYKAVELEELALVMVSCKKKVPRALWKKLSKVLSDNVRTVRIVEKSSSLKAVLSQILSPARISTINTVWLPDGSWESSVEIVNEDFKKLPAEPRVLEALIKSLIKEKVVILPPK